MDRSIHHRPMKRRRASLLVFLSVLGLVSFMTIGTGPGFASSDGSRYREPLSKEAIIELTNNARLAKGLLPLEENTLLDAIAEARARDILDKQYFAHVSPTGEEASWIARKIGYSYRIIAENLAGGVFFTNCRIVECWMQSPGHRRNILSVDVREMGASIMKGRLNGAEICVCVQIFGLPQLALSTRSTYDGPSTNEVATDNLVPGSAGSNLRKIRRGIDQERNLIERDFRILTDDPGKNENLNLRIRAYNEKVDRYNQALAQARFAGAMADARD